MNGFLRPWRERVTPFSGIDLDQWDHDRSVSTMEVQLDEAVLVIRGKRGDKEVEIMVGNLDAQGPTNGIVLIETQERQTFEHRAMYTTLSLGSEYRLLVDCALEPDKKGHAYSVRLRDVNS